MGIEEVGSIKLNSLIDVIFRRYGVTEPKPSSVIPLLGQLSIFMLC